MKEWSSDRSFESFIHSLVIQNQRVPWNQDSNYNAYPTNALNVTDFDWILLTLSRVCSNIQITNPYRSIQSLFIYYKLIYLFIHSLHAMKVYRTHTHTKSSPFTYQTHLKYSFDSHGIITGNKMCNFPFRVTCKCTLYTKTVSNWDWLLFSYFVVNWKIIEKYSDQCLCQVIKNLGEKKLDFSSQRKKTPEKV